MAPRQTKVFISSSMKELASERKVVHELLTAMGGFEPFAYEFDAVASSTGPKELWERDLDTSNVCLVILFEKLGEWTVAEIERALERSIPVLVFVKEQDVDGDGVAETVASEVRQYLRTRTSPKTGVFSEKRFSEAAQLNQFVRDALEDLTHQAFLDAQQLKALGDIDEASTLEGHAFGVSETDDELGDQVDEMKPSKSVPRPDGERRRVPLFPANFLGRSYERDVLGRMIDSQQRFVPVTGLDEVGRKSLLEVMSHDAEFAARFPGGSGLAPQIRGGAAVPEGAVALDADGESADHDDGLGDLLQAIWETAFTVGDTVEGTGGIDVDQRARDLASLDALVALLDVALTPEQATALVQALPKAYIAATMVEGASTGQFRPLPMGPMEGDELVAAFSEHSFVPVPDDLKDAVLAAFESTGGRPAEVVALANKAVADRVRPDGLADWLAEVGAS